MPAAFIVILTIAEALIIFCHYLISQFFINTFGIDSFAGILSVRIIFFLLSISFLSAQLLAYRANNAFSRSFYKITAVWMGVFIYLFFATVLGVFFPPIIGEIFILLAFIISVYGIINAAHIRIIKLEVMLSNLPAVWQGKKIVFLSDTHIGQVRNLNFLSRIGKIIDEQNPELILHGGDFYDGVKTDVQGMADIFARFKSRRGIYFVTGNHESFEDPDRYAEPLRRAGINVLTNEMKDLAGLQIIGIDYSSSEKPEEYSRILESMEMDSAKPSILVKHMPLHFEIAAKKGIDLVLSGHSHHGQMWPFRYITRAIFKGYDYGLKKMGDLRIYTSSGVGTWGPPIRTFTKSEIVVIELNNEE